jgi:hypothetical protein
MFWRKPCQRFCHDSSSSSVNEFTSLTSHHRRNCLSGVGRAIRFFCSGWKHLNSRDDFLRRIYLIQPNLLLVPRLLYRLPLRPHLHNKRAHAVRSAHPVGSGMANRHRVCACSQFRRIDQCCLIRARHLAARRSPQILHSRNDIPHLCFDRFSWDNFRSRDRTDRQWRRHRECTHYRWAWHGFPSLSKAEGTPVLTRKSF